MSTVRRLATGKKPRVTFALETAVARRGGDIIFEYLSSPLTGYVWYIPQGPEEALIGCGCAGHDLPAGLRGQIEEALDSFCGREGYRMTAPFRGAPIPLGNDILLRAGENVYFVGDAAGLIGQLGAGIWSALLSGEKLAEALCGGTLYEESMREETDMLTQVASNGIKAQFLKNFTIMRKGVPYTPGK
jgi:flavin-dependent dehydrogenase